MCVKRNSALPNFLFYYFFPVQQTTGGIGQRVFVGGKEKEWMGVLPGQLQSFRHQSRPADNCSPGRGEMVQSGGTRGGTFHGEINRCRENQGWTTACSRMPEVTGKTKERIAQSKRARASSLALVD